MKKITNADILKILAERDRWSVFHNGEISLASKSLFGNNSLKQLVRNLENASYCLSQQDVNLLRDYNIFVGANDNLSNGGFIAISDFHGYDYPLDKIKDYYVYEYDKIYILGDAIDRGPFGSGKDSLKVLMQIKDLCDKYPDRVVYIPGNHDEFLVGAARNDYNYCCNLVYNGGEDTLNELRQLRKQRPEKFTELISWLETLPIQRTHIFNGKRYVFAHAFFDEKLYNYNPNYCLREYLESNNTYSDAAKNVLWFRKNGDSYDKDACPKSGNVMVIGHTPDVTGNKEYDLVDSYGRRVEVQCVDGGIAYNGEMLKYDGKKRIRTAVGRHNNTSFSNSCDRLDEARACLHNYFITQLYLKENKFFDNDMYFIPNNVSSEEFFEIIDSYEGKHGFSYNTNDYEKRYSIYKKIFVFDLLVQNIIDKYGSTRSVSDVFSNYLFGNQDDAAGDVEYFTRDRDTRFFAKTLGLESMMEVLALHNCESIEEYVDTKTIVDSNGKIKIKKI